MNIDRIISNSKQYIDFEIAYKEDSRFMKFLGSIMFFNKDFHRYITTINNTIYFPSKTYFADKPVSSIATLLHELVHVSDKNRLTFVLFSLIYLSPQILFLLCIPLFFLIPIKFALISLLLLAPLPALGRAWLEYRAYCMSLYVAYVLSIQYNIQIDFQAMKAGIIKQFTGSGYYFMFPFKSFIDKKLNEAFEKCLHGKHPFEDKIFDRADLILEKK